MFTGYKLHFRIIRSLPEVLSPLEIGHGTPMYAGFITNVNRRSDNVNQHALESMKEEDKYSNTSLIKPQLKDSNAVYIYVRISTNIIWVWTPN